MKVIWLEISVEEAGKRLGTRKHDLVGKFQKILAGQFRDLEKPKNAVVLDASLPHPQQLKAILSAEKD